MIQVIPNLSKFYITNSLPWGLKDRVLNLNSKGGGHILERSRCATCGKQHLGKGIAGTDGLFGCSNKGHKMRDIPNLKEKGKEVNEAPQGGLDRNAPKWNCFYALV